MNASTTASLHWFKATRSSSSSSCVEVALAGAFWLIRDSKYLRDPRNDATAQPIIAVSVGKWRGFLDAVLDRSAAGCDGLPSIGYRKDGWVSIVAGSIALTYTPSEWDAFCDGVRKHEFDRFPSVA
ncbi:DUF397 domain-containing protein [Nocardia nova]|jgi:hypothetical protein|uniref:DUF397 domain-containing protein n=1 Tax=Nocardia nova TaxID=37330 RepID=UPI0007A41DD9|nr:DUF397 domain-containing protein [Nocardia nova]